MAEEPGDMRNAAAVSQALSAFPSEVAARRLAALYYDSDDPAVKARVIAAMRLVLKQGNSGGAAPELICHTARYAINDADPLVAYHAFRAIMESGLLLREDALLFERRIESITDIVLGNAMLEAIAYLGELEWLLEHVNVDRMYQRGNKENIQRWTALLARAMFNCPSDRRPSPDDRAQLLCMADRDPRLADRVFRFLVKMRDTDAAADLKKLMSQTSQDKVKVGIHGALCLLDKSPSEHRQALLASLGKAAAAVKADSGTMDAAVQIVTWISFIVSRNEDEALLREAWNACAQLTGSQRAIILSEMLDYLGGCRVIVLRFLNGLTDEELLSYMAAQEALAERVAREAVPESYIPGTKSTHETALMAGIKERLAGLASKAAGLRRRN